MTYSTSTEWVSRPKRRSGQGWFRTNDEGAIYVSAGQITYTTTQATGSYEDFVHVNYVRTGADMVQDLFAAGNGAFSRSNTFIQNDHQIQLRGGDMQSNLRFGILWRNVWSYLATNLYFTPGAIRDAILHFRDDTVMLGQYDSFAGALQELQHRTSTLFVAGNTYFFMLISNDATAYGIKRIVTYTPATVVTNSNLHWVGPFATTATTAQYFLDNLKVNTGGCARGVEYPGVQGNEL